MGRIIRYPLLGWVYEGVAVGHIERYPLLGPANTGRRSRYHSENILAYLLK